MYPIWNDPIKQYREQFQREIREDFSKCIEEYQQILKLNPLYPCINTNYVYFLKKDGENIVKIGYSWCVHNRTKDVGRQLFDSKCEIVGLIYGGRLLEEKTHRKFHHLHIKGSFELFIYTDEIRFFIEENMLDRERDLIKILNNRLFPKDEEDSIYIVVESWADLRKIRCEIVGETKRRFKVKLFESAKLPNGKIGIEGDEVSVPKHAVRFSNGDEK